MALTSEASNKTAFVFTGSLDQRYINDVRKVLETLILFYGYLPENIDVVSPDPIPDFEIVGLPDEDNIFHASGLSNTVIAGADADEYTGNLESSLSGFMTELTTQNIPGFRNSALLYFTGQGSSVTAGLTMYQLEIGRLAEPPEDPVNINQLWLTSLLSSHPDAFQNSQISIVMQQSHCYGFWSGTGGISSIIAADAQISFTSACDAGENSTGNLTGSEFTDNWIKALQLVSRNGGTVFADQEETNPLSLPGETSEDTTNHLVSMKKAYFYAASFADPDNTDPDLAQSPKYEEKGDEIKYPGLPSFLIRDGDQADPPVAWYESPDIFLTHPDSDDPDQPDDIYHPDTTNIIHVNIENTGTHPVREFWVGSIVFYSGGGGLGDSAAFIENVILRPGDVYQHQYGYDFPETHTHRCIRAKAQLEPIDPEEMDQDGVDDVAWFVRDRDCEAQRNIDKIVVQPSPSPPPPPGGGEFDEGDAGAEAEPPDDATDPEATGSRSLVNLRGFKEHIYHIRNVFKRPHRFILVFPGEFMKMSRLFRIEFYDVTDKRKKKPVPLKIVKKPACHIALDIAPGETRKLLMYFAAKPRVKFNGELNLPFEILVDSKPVKKDLEKLLKGMGFEQEVAKYASFGGVTICASMGRGATLYGRVTDRNGKPVPGAIVVIKTVNGRQSAVVKADARGYYRAPGIDPDIYTISYKSMKSEKAKLRIMAKPGIFHRVDLNDNNKTRPARRNR